MGMAKTNPMPPHTQPQKSSAMVIATAFKRTRAAHQLWRHKIDSQNVDGSERRGNQHELPELFHFASAITKAGSQPSLPRCTAPCSGVLKRFP